MPLLSLKKSRVIAHRGAFAYAPENTLASMRKAHDLGASWVEFDVILAGCGKVVVHHDDNLERTTGVNRLVVETSYEQMRELDAGSWFSAEFANERIPSFRELLGCLNDLDMHINVEIKPTLGKEVETAERVLEVFLDCWPYHQRGSIITSQNIQCLRAIRQRAPEIDLGCVIHDWHEHWQEWVQELGCLVVSVNHQILDPNMVQQVKEVVPLVVAYTVNDKSQANTLFKWGVDAVFSDYPDIL